MAQGLIGRKIGMTQVFSEDGTVQQVTVLQLGPCKVIRKKTEQSDGYDALQLGFGSQKMNRLTKAQKGLFEKKGLPAMRVLKEFKGYGDDYKEGDDITVEIFEDAERVKVTGISKGKGFQGVVKRYGHHGGPKTHGSRFHRRPGAIGACADPGKVIKGTKLPGQMGGRQVSIRNIKINAVDKEKNLILLEGAVPGSNNSIVTVERIG